MSWRNNPVIEMVGMIALVVGVGAYLNPGDPLLTEYASIHPFFAVILLISIRYANPYAFYSGLICCTLYLFGLWHNGENLLQAIHISTTLILPAFLFIAEGAVLGESIGKYAARTRYYKEQAAELTEQIQEARNRSDMLEEAYRKVEGRIAGQNDSLVALNQGMRSLYDITDEDVFFESFIDMLRRYLGVRACSVWKTADGVWRVLDAGTFRSGQIPKLGQIAYDQRRTVTAAEFFAKRNDAGDAGLMAGLIHVYANNPPYVIVIEKMQFREFTQQSEWLFDLSLFWVQLMLRRGAALSEDHAAVRLERQMGLVDEHLFRSIVRKILQAEKRLKGSSTLLVITFQAAPTNAITRHLLIIFAGCLRNSLRQSDTATYFSDSHFFAVHLPETKAEGTSIVTGKLQKAMDQLQLQPYATDESFHIFTQEHTMNEPKDLDGILEILREDHKTCALS